MFSGVKDTGILDPLCMVLDTCCGGEGGRRRLNELCDEGLGLPILVQVVDTASQGELSSPNPHNGVQSLFRANKISDTNLYDLFRFPTNNLLGLQVI